MQVRVATRIRQVIGTVVSGLKIEEASMMHLEIFMQENPELMKVKGSSNEAVLRWANEKGFIVFKRFGKTEFYTEADERTALMWKEKVQE